MAGNEQEVRIRIKALDRISDVLDKVRKKFPDFERSVKSAANTIKFFNEKTKGMRKALKSAGDGLTSVGKTMTAGVTLPVALAGASIIGIGVDFERSMNAVGAKTNTIINGQVTPAFLEMQKLALDLGAKTEFSAKQAADAMHLLGRAGFKPAEIMATTEHVLALATASGMDLAFTADVMAKTLRQFGLEADQAGRVADVFADVSRKTNVDLETISETMKNAAPIARQFGMSLEQTSAMMGFLGDIGIQGERAGTTMKAIMVRFAAPSKKAKEILSALGVSTVNAAGQMKNAGELFAEIGPKIGKLNKDKQLAIINELFGLEGIAGSAALMSKAMEDGKNPIATLTTLLENSHGAAKQMQDIMNRGAPGALNRFSSSVEGVGLAFAQSGILDSFSKILDKLTEWLNVIGELNPDILMCASVIAIFAAAIGPALIAVGSLLLFINQMIIFFPILTSVVLPAVGAIAMFTAEVLLWVAAFYMLVWMIDRVIKRWDDMIAGFKQGKGIIDSLKNGIGAFFTDEDIASRGTKFSKTPFPGLHDKRPEGFVPQKPKEEGLMAGFAKEVAPWLFKKNDQGIMKDIGVKVEGVAGLPDDIKKVMKDLGGSDTARMMQTLDEMARKAQPRPAPVIEQKPKLGPPVGADASLNKVSTRGVTNTNNARVDINVSAPSGTKAKAVADQKGLMSFNMGLSGGIQ